MPLIGRNSISLPNFMYLIRFFTLIFSLLLISGCGANKKSSQQEKNLVSAQDTVKMSSDTIPKPSPPPPGLPPGEARVRGEIVEVGNQTNNQNSSFFKIKVNRVLGYGSSTPPVGTADTLLVNMRVADQNHFKIGKIVSAVISYRQLPGDSGNSSRWTLVTLEKDSN